MFRRRKDTAHYGYSRRIVAYALFWEPQAAFCVTRRDSHGCRYSSEYTYCTTKWLLLRTRLMMFTRLLIAISLLLVLVGKVDLSPMTFGCVICQVRSFARHDHELRCMPFPECYRHWLLPCCCCVCYAPVIALPFATVTTAGSNRSRTIDIERSYHLNLPHVTSETDH